MPGRSLDAAVDHPVEACHEVSEFTAPDKRDEVLAEFQAAKMVRSAHAYVRGSTAKFYEWFVAPKPYSLPEGPSMWICGDCHAGNLGPLANARGTR
jgi:uncharacterized protein (DUF2252 family)